MNNNFKAYLMLILCAFFWSGNFIVGKFATLYEVPPLTLNFFRWLIVWIILIPFTLLDILKNIKYSKDIIANYKGTWGLITSANHMPRSFFTFKKQGLILEPISVDYKTGTSKMFWINFDIFSGLNNWRIIFHELIGIAYYKVTDKI